MPGERILPRGERAEHAARRGLMRSHIGIQAPGSPQVPFGLPCGSSRGWPRGWGWLFPVAPGTHAVRAEQFDLRCGRPPSADAVAAADVLHGGPAVCVPRPSDDPAQGVSGEVSEGGGGHVRFGVTHQPRSAGSRASTTPATARRGLRARGRCRARRSRRPRHS